MEDAEPRKPRTMEERFTEEDVEACSEGQVRYDYYLHRSGGRVFDYFGGIGLPYKVGCIRAGVMKVLGYSVTRVPRRITSLQRIYLRAALTRGAHRRSFKVEQIRKGILEGEFGERGNE